VSIDQHRRTTRTRFFLVGILLYALSGWAAYEIVGPRLIELVYRGQGPAAITSLLESRGTIPLSTYLDRGRTLFFGLHTFVVWITLCGVLHVRFRLLDRHAEVSPRRVTTVALGVFLLAPFVLLKFVLASALLSLAGFRDKTTFAPHRVAIALFGLWGAAFLLAPSWMTVSGSLWVPALLIVAGIVWSMRAAGRVTFEASRVAPLSLLGLALGILLVNYRALTAPIAWRGDEGYHIAIVLTVIQNPLWIAAAAFGVLALWWGNVSSRAAATRLLVVLGVMFLLVGRTYADQVDAAARYPFATRWIEALPVQLLSFSPSLVRKEAFFRLVPFGSTVLIAALVLSRLQARPVLGWLTASAVVTTPIMGYYTSILYLELPAVLLALVVSLSLRDIVESSVETVRESGAWLALLTLAFLKETMLPFLVVVIAVRLAYQAHRGRSLTMLRAELEIAALVLAPMVLYLVFRRAGGAPRAYGFALAQMFSADSYVHFALSWREQAPALAVLFVAGSLLLAMSGEVLLPIFSWLVVLASAAFIAGDTAAYAGYSRFNLLILPVLIGTTVTCLQKLGASEPRRAHLIAFAWLSVNWLWLPIYADGSRVPQWGSRVADTADYTYPYRDALVWIRDHHPDARLFATGLDYPYSFDFYFRQLNWQPPFRMHLIQPGPVRTREEIDRFFGEAARDNAAVVLYHVRAEDLTPTARVSPFEVERMFTNRAHRLLVYRLTTVPSVPVANPERPSAAAAIHP
jgi:hypothetical protein